MPYLGLPHSYTTTNKIILAHDHMPIAPKPKLVREINKEGCFPVTFFPPIGHGEGESPEGSVSTPPPRDSVGLHSVVLPHRFPRVF